MTQLFAEILLLVPSTLCTGFLVFIAGVIQKVMNELDESDFQKFLKLLDKHALKSPYAIGVSSITFVGMIPYWYFFGLSNIWFSAGLIVYTIASIVSKSVNLPIYKKIFALDNSDAVRLDEERRNLHRGNLLRASIQSASIVLMMLGFL